MRRALALARAGATSVLLHPLRSAVTVACVVAILLPYVAGLAISGGVRAQADDALRLGADLTVSGERLGRPVPVPASAAAELRAIPGVVDVVPRVTGEIRLGRDGVSAVLVGLGADRLPPSTALVEGRLFAAGGGNELVVGRELARRLGLTVGARIPPFYRNDAGERVSTVVGIFRADLPIWSAQVVFASAETAAAVFAQHDLASALLVTCAPGRAEDVRRAIVRLPRLGPDDAHGPVRPHVVAREDAAALLPAGLLAREGVFTLHWLLAFAVGIPLVLVSTGAGLAERRRETALLKALGWQTDEVLLRAGVESVLLALAAAALAVLCAAVWLGPLHGAGLASVFLGGADASFAVDLPWVLAPVPIGLAVVIALVVVTTGTIASSWRAASAPPREVLR